MAGQESIARVHIEHAHDQDWQKALDAGAGSVVGGDYSTGPRENPGQDAIMADGGVTKSNEPDLNTGKGIAGWILKVEGRLLDVSGGLRFFFRILMLMNSRTVWKR